MMADPVFNCVLPFQAEVSVEFIPTKKLDIHVRETFDKETLKSSLEAFDAEIKAGTEDWANKVRDVGDLSIVDSQNYKLNPRTKMVESFINERRVIGPGKVLKRTFSFTLIK